MGIDFPNSFVWGDAQYTKMATPGCGVNGAAACVATDIDAGASGTCTNIKEWYFNFISDENGSVRPKI